MHRIDTPTAQKDKFGAGKNGFTRGNPQIGTPATDLDDDYFDMLQEELAGVVEASGATLDKTKHTQLLTALGKLLLSRAHPFADIKSDGNAAIAEAISNLGLGTAALRDVGAGAANNTVPDMGSFIRALASVGYQNIPGGLLIQWGTVPISGSGTTAVANFPVPFPNAAFLILMCDTGGATTTYGTTNRSRTGFTAVRNISSGSTVGFYLALGN